MIRQVKNTACVLASKQIDEERDQEVPGVEAIPALMQLCPEIEVEYTEDLGCVFKRASENKWSWVFCW